MCGMCKQRKKPAKHKGKQNRGRGRFLGDLSIGLRLEVLCGVSKAFLRSSGQKRAWETWAAPLAV